MLVFLFAGIMQMPGESLINREDSPLRFSFETEQGTLAVVRHTIQIGDGGDVFDYRKEGGQELLFPFSRYQAEMTAADRHLVSLLYQPLRVVTKVSFAESRTIDGVEFEAGTPMELTYGFPFYRLTYGYDLLPGDHQLYIGALLQMRNASIVFRDLGTDSGNIGDYDERSMVVSQNLGPVPALFIRGRYELPSGAFFQAEAAGIYASSRFINGADFDFTGSLLDASLRAGYPLRNGMEVFLALRYLGGSAEGESEYAQSFWTDSKNPYTANNLSTVTLAAGLTVR